MSLFATLTKKLGDTIAGFEATEVSDDLSSVLSAVAVTGGMVRPFEPSRIFRVRDGEIPPTVLTPNLAFDLPSADFISAIPVQFERTKVVAETVDFESTEFETVDAALEPAIGDDLLESLKRARISKDLSQSRLNPPVDTEVSDNLFRPLLPHGVNGKHYQPKKADSQSSLFSVAKAKTDGFAKAYTRKKSTGSSASFETQSMSFWDMLYPVLMPPVNTDFGEQFELFQPLFKFQPAGVEFLVNCNSALLADEMGTGKTVMSAVALKLLFRLGKARKALIVCPVSLLRTWQDHLQDWADELQLTVVRGPQDVRKLDWKYPAHVYLTTYDTVASDFLSKVKKEQSFKCPKCKKEVYLGEQIVVEDEEIPTYTCPHCRFPLTDYLLTQLKKKESIVQPEMVNSFDVVLVDEAQYIKNKTSQRSRAIRLLKPNFRWALSGTPIENRIDDLVSIFSFVKPDLFHNEHYISPKRASDLIKPYFLRRLKKDVMKDLPPKVKQEMWLELDADQRRAYNEAERSGIDEIENMENVTKVHIFALISKLKQICNFAPSKDASPKTGELLDLVEQIKENGQKVLVFSQYATQGVEKLERLLQPYGVSVLKGGLSDAARNSAISTFKKNKDICVFLATIKTGGVGLTLTEASYVIHFDHWWNPALMWQADDRVHRSGQKSSQVNIYSFWTQDTIEERIYSVLKEKHLLFDEVINGLSSEQIDEMISTDEWLNILGIKTKSKRSGARTKTSSSRDAESATTSSFEGNESYTTDKNSQSSYEAKQSEDTSRNAFHSDKEALKLLRKAHITLGVDVGASSAVITAAYRRMAKLYHPDKTVGASDDKRRYSDEKMKELNQAYALLREHKCV